MSERAIASAATPAVQELLRPPVRDCPACDRASMIALSPMHPHTYLWLLCSAHRAEQLDWDTSRKIGFIKADLRDYVQRVFHDANEQLGLIPRCCHNTEWVDGYMPVRCGRWLDAAGRCHRCDRCLDAMRGTK